MLCHCVPPSIGTKRTHGIQVCAVRVDVGWEQVPMRLVVGAGVGGNGLTGTGQRLFLVIGGTYLGMLFLVHRTYVR